MAAEFIGSNVLVTLKSPPDGQVLGIVADIVGQQLTLHDGGTTMHCLPVLSPRANRGRFDSYLAYIGS